MPKKHKKQNIPDVEWWNLNDYLAAWILPRLKLLRKYGHSCPFDATKVFDVNLSDREQCLTLKQWRRILKKIERSFELVTRAHDYGWQRGLSDEEIQARRAKEDQEWQEGMDLFVLYFGALWD